MPALPRSSGSSQSAGPCTKCAEGVVTCRFNLFDRGDLVVHSWEHKCGNCGWRETQAFRSDAPHTAERIDPTVCPWCGRQGSTA